MSGLHTIISSSFVLIQFLVKCRRQRWSTVRYAVHVQLSVSYHRINTIALDALDLTL